MMPEIRVFKKAWNRFILIPHWNKEKPPEPHPGLRDLRPSNEASALLKPLDKKIIYDTCPRLAGIEYKALDESKSEIRILNILPGAEDSDISCTIQQLPTIGVYPPYNALSYCWGDPDDTVSITVDSFPVAVTKNLEAALRIFRKTGRYAIWVDALCINQDDEDERGNQILRMGAIYKNSVETIAWLGPDEGGFAETAFNRLKLFASQIPKDEFDEAIKQLKGGRPCWRRFPGWIAVKVFMGLPYWKRTWIIQEVILSSRVSIWWGDQSLTLNNLSDAFDGLKIGKTVSGFEDGYRNINCLLRIWEIVTERPDSSGRVRRTANFFEILSTTSRSFASERKDKIFGVLGLSPDGPRLIPSPKYRKPIDDIIRDLTIAMLELNMFVNDIRPMDHICLDNPRIPKRLDIPSWVTDWPNIWNMRGGEMWSSASERGMESNYTASGNSHASVSFSDDRSTLHVRGFIFDIINSLSTQVNPADLHKYEAKSVIEEPRSNADSKPLPEENVYGKSRDLYEAIWRSLVADRTSDVVEIAPSWYGYHFGHLWSKEYQRSVGRKYLYAPMMLPAIGSFEVQGIPLVTWATKYGSQEPTPFQSEYARTRKMKEFICSLGFVDLLRRVLTTQGGSVGLSPTQSEVGDKICLI